MTKIFISYSWDSPEHKDWVFFEIAEKLREDGLECVSDHDVGFQEQRWTHWMEDQIEEADFVLVVCTEIYLKRYRGKDTDGGRGVTYEGAIISQTLYDAHCRNKKFIAVIPEAGSFDNVPLALKGYNIYQLPQQYDHLFRIISKQPEYESSPVSPSIKTLPAKNKLTNPAPTFRHNHLPTTKRTSRNKELLDMWEDRLFHFEKALIVCSDDSRKFSIQIEIEECQKKIEELKNF